jgi:hypothetical protein
MQLMHLYSAISLLILGTGSYMAWAAWGLRAPWVILAPLTLPYLAVSGPLSLDGACRTGSSSSRRRSGD